MTLGLLLAAFLGSAQGSEAAPSAADDGAMQAELAGLVNAYRREHGLPPVPLSRSLTRVAELHVRDLELNHPDSGTDPRGQRCNTHSWSAAGPWTPVCYTPDHRYGSLMWSKPREITGGAYRGDGFEIAAGGPGFAITPAYALRSWQGSRFHHEVILQQGMWDEPWRAMGVGLHGGYAVIWFGHEPDGAR
jgi:cysteine-rich secretory family protein